MIIVFVLHMLILDPIVIGVGHRDQTVEHLNDKQCGEETNILSEIKENALPGNTQTSFQILN